MALIVVRAMSVTNQGSDPRTVNALATKCLADALVHVITGSTSTPEQRFRALEVVVADMTLGLDV